jgi:hypothetical protein
MKNNNNALKLVTVTLLLCSFGAQAQNIVYQVDRAFDGGVVIGSIETDGTLGTLGSGNIESWSFEAYDGADVVSISSASGGLQGNAWKYLTATSTSLSFDFDGAGADDAAELIAFVGFDGSVPFTASYNLLGNFVGKVEQFIHQFGTPSGNGEHGIGSLPREGSVVIARSDQPLADCSDPSVSLGEVLAGFQAGFTAGSHTDVGPVGEYFIALGGEDSRGFIVPEEIDSSRQCANDFILVSGFIGVPFARRDGTTLTPKEALDLAASGGNGFFAAQRFEVDGVLIEHMNTTAKLASLPDGRRAAIVTSGIVLEPYSHGAGVHTATITYDLDFNRDGIVDREVPFRATFTISEPAAGSP